MGISTVAASFVATSAAKAAVTVDVLKSTTLGAIAAAAKWTLVGVSAAALTVGAVRQYQAHTAGNAGQVSASLTPTPARNLPQRNEPLLAPAPVPLTPPAPSLPSSRATEPRTAEPSGAINVSEEPVAHSLAEEVAALDKVRSAAQAHNPSLMLRLLNEYQREFPNGALAIEAQVLLVEALVQSGQTAAAMPLARQLLNAAPSGPHASRIRALLPGLEE
jgi:TolA-binding protein